MHFALNYVGDIIFLFKWQRVIFTIWRIWKNSKNFCAKNYNCIGALSFVKYVHTFSGFLKSYRSIDFGNAETRFGLKKRVISRREFFYSNFRVRELCLNKKFDFSLVVFCSHAAISLWVLLFFIFFFGSDYSSNCFFNPFIVHSRPVVLTKFLASGVQFF